MTRRAGWLCLIILMAGCTSVEPDEPPAPSSVLSLLSGGEVDGSLLHLEIPFTLGDSFDTTIIVEWRAPYVPAGRAYVRTFILEDQDTGRFVDARAYGEGVTSADDLNPIVLGASAAGRGASADVPTGMPPMSDDERWQRSTYEFDRTFDEDFFARHNADPIQNGTLHLFFAADYPTDSRFIVKSTDAVFSSITATEHNGTVVRPKDIEGLVHVHGVPQATVDGHWAGIIDGATVIWGAIWSTELERAQTFVVEDPEGTRYEVGGGGYGMIGRGTGGTWQLHMDTMVAESQANMPLLFIVPVPVG